jgi:CRP/FNR family transcriptional regulator, dissimilatory nitrate respiration regulator
MKYSVLVNSPIFRGIGEEDIYNLITGANCKFRTYNEGAVVALRNEDIHSLMIVLSGEVRGEMVDLSGKIIKIEDIKAPMALAAAFIFGPGSRFPVNIVANVNTDLLVIDKSDFMTMMQKDIRVLRNYLSVICGRASFLSDRLHFLSFRTIKGKMANYILSLASADNNKVVLEKTQQELADYFGVARPSLARALGGLQADKLLKVKNREVEILNRAALIKLTEE